MKVLASVLIYVMCILFLFSSCGKFENKQPEDTSANDMSSIVSLDHKDRTVETVHYFIRNSLKASIDIDEINQELSRLCINMINIDLQLHEINTVSYGKEIQTMIHSGERIDFCDPVDVLSVMSNELIEQYNLADITDLLYRYYPSVNEISYESIKDQIELDGRIYAVPGYMMGSQSNLVYAVTNKALFEKSQVGSITNFLDYINYYNICVENNLLDKDQVFVCDIDMFIRLYLECFGYYNLYDGLVYSPHEKTIVAQETTPEFFDAYEIYIDMFNKGFLSYTQEETVTPHSMYQPSFTNYTAQNLTYGELNRYNLLAFEGFNDNHEIFIINETTARHIPYSVMPNYYVIHNGNEENTLKTILFLKTNQDVNDIFRYGILDKNYALKDDKVCLFDNQSSGIMWRSAFYFSPSLERRFISEDNSCYNLRKTIVNNIPFPYDRYQTARSALFLNSLGLNINDFYEKRNLKHVNKDDLYKKSKDGMEISEFVKMMYHDQLDDFLEYFIKEVYGE